MLTLFEGYSLHAAFRCTLIAIDDNIIELLISNLSREFIWWLGTS